MQSNYKSPRSDWDSGQRFIRSIGRNRETGSPRSSSPRLAVPFSKVSELSQNGIEFWSSIVGFFGIIPEIFKRN